MYLVTGIIRPHQLDGVREALAGAGFKGMTVTEVRGFGRQKGHAELYRGAEYVIDFLPKIKLEVVVTGDRLDAVLEIVRCAARTGHVGDGKLFVVPVEQAMRIRTGELDGDAL